MSTYATDRNNLIATISLESRANYPSLIIAIHLAPLL